MSLPKVDDRYRCKAALQGTIEKRMRIQRLNDERMGKMILKNRDTFWRKRTKDDRCFTWDELIIIFHKLNFTNDEILECMSVDYKDPLRREN